MSAPLNLLDELFATLETAIVIVDDHDRALLLNEAAAALLGGVRDELQGQDLDALFHGSLETAKFAALLDEARRGNHPSPALLPIDVGYGTRCVLIDAAPLASAPGHVRLSFGDASPPELQLAEHRQTLDALERSNQRLSLIFQHAPYIIGLMRADGTFSYVNRVLDGYDSQQILTDPASLLEPHDLEAFHRAVQTVFAGQQAHTECRDLHGRWWDTHFVPVPTHTSTPEAIVFITDVTERQQAIADKARIEAQYQYAQKLESLGVLAGGVAHDFNNLLSGILGNAELAERMLDNDHPSTMFIEEIIKTADRASELCRQLLAYSGKGSFVVRPTRFSEVISNMTNLLKVSVPRRVSLKYDFADELPTVEADLTQLQQIVVNLVTNAAEAIHERSGNVTVRTSNAHFTTAALANTCIDDKLPEGEYVVLEVTDDGVGMDANTRQRVFEPFFSTRGPGRGLGLAAVLGIVRGHRGAIAIDSEPGRGTTVRVMLPASTEAIRPPRPTAPRRSPPERKRQLLIVDDEKAVLSMMEQALRHSGFLVQTASDGQAALTLLQDQAHDIDLVLLDLTMPGLDGEQTYRRIKALQPNLPIALMSGYSEQTSARSFVKDDGAPFLAKPFRIADLLAVVQTALEKHHRDP